jgi:predicted ATPase
VKLTKLRIVNYRCFKDQEIVFDDYSCLVGPNGSGKSTVLMALNIFFRNNQAPSDVLNLDEEDFHDRNTSESIEITATFTDLSDEAKDDLKAYVRQDELVITARAEWNEVLRSAEVRQLGVRQVIKDFAPYFEADEAGERAAGLKSIFAQLRSKYEDINVGTTKDAMRTALREYEESHPDLCEPLESKNQFYGWSKGANLLAKHCQWVYLPAIKDPTEEQDEQRNSALGKLLERSIRSQIDFSESISDLQREARDKYEAILNSQDNALDEIGSTIQDRLREWAHPGARVELGWHLDEKKSVTVADPYARAKVGEGGFLGEIVRTGHGMQRSFLIALLQVLANIDEEARPTLILGFEEPELYQHPPQAKHLATLLEELSTQDTQAIVTTHSPYFVSSKGYENIRLFRLPEGATESTISQITYEELSERLATALGSEPQPPTSLMAAVEQIMQPSQNELFFCKVPVLVEGPEDVAFISTYLHHSGKWAEFRRLGCHFVVCEGKTNMSRPLAIANGLNLPTFVVFDGDCDKEELDEHRRDNSCLLSLLDEESELIVEAPFFGLRSVMWHTRILNAICSEVGEETWSFAENDARDTYKLQVGVRRKNPVLITATLEKLLSDGVRFDLLDKLCTNLVAYAENTPPGGESVA